MEKKTKLLIILIGLLFLSCESESNLLIEDTLTGDALLKQLLIDGKYVKYEGEIHEYFSNGTFSEKWFSRDPNNPLNSLPYITRTGEFDVIDSLLIESNVSLEYHDSTELEFEQFTSFWFDRELLVLNDSIWFRMCEVLYPVNGQSDSLWGIWERIEWISKHYPSTNLSYNGRYHKYYNFKNDSTKIYFKGTLLDDPSKIKSELYLDFIYNEPTLFFLGNDLRSVNVRFKNNRMYWY